MKNCSLFTICCLLLLTIAAPVFAEEAAFSRPVEIRGVWMDKNSIPKTEKGVREMIRSYARAGINLVHPEVIFNGYSSYKSDYLTQKDLYPGIDMLGILIDESHKQGIEVHPWVWVFRTGNAADKGGILTQHPKWAMLDRAGSELTENESYWLSPSIPGVRRLLLNAFLELVRKYPIDGIQLDYIRYPSANHDYNPLARDKYMLEKGIDPIDIEPFSKGVIDWHLWREEQINSFVRQVSAELRWIRPSLQISAAVASYPDKARISYLQDWEFWAQNRWVDFLAPMDYTANLVDFMNRLQASTDKVRFEALLAPGIGLYVQKESKPMLDQIHIADTHPVDGVTLFATAYLDDDRLEALRKGPFRKKAQLPFRSPLEKAKVLLSSAQDKLKEGIDFGPLLEAQSETETAKKLMDWTSYRKLAMGRSVQAPPPIFIPETVVPLPEVSVPLVSAVPAIDGKLDDPVWQNAAKINLEYTSIGDEAAQPTEVLLAYDAQNLYIAYRCIEPNPDRIKATVTERDKPVFYEDSAEVFLNLHPESEASYYQFAMNALGTQYEAMIYDTSFNPEWQTACRGGSATPSPTDNCSGGSCTPARIEGEMAIPFSAFKMGTPPAGTVWRANFCRNRFAGTTDSQGQNMCWSPTYGSFHTPIRFGKIVFSGKAD